MGDSPKCACGHVHHYVPCDHARVSCKEIDCTGPWGACADKHCPCFAFIPSRVPESGTPRTPDGITLHDGAIHDPKGCPRGQQDCAPLSRIASPGFESFMCCGETSNAPVPTDRLRLCIKSTHKHGVDVLVNLDERDAVHTCSALMGGLAALGSVSITARGE